jgi:hypothetical protein
LLPLLNCRAADAPPPASEEALMQKLDRLNQEVATTKQQLETIRNQKHEPVPASEKAAAEPAPSPSAESPNLFSDFVKQVNLRNSVFDKDAFDKPAAISYTRPGSGPASYAIDAGLKVEMQPLFFPWGETLSPSLGIDYHRNTNAGNLMDRVQVGTQFEYTLGSTATSPVALEITGDVSYKVDNAKSLDSLIGSTKMQPVLRFEKMGLPGFALLNSDNYQRLWTARWRWEPFLGLQYEDTTQTGAGVQSGHHALVNYGVELQVDPFFTTTLGKKVEFTAAYKGDTPVNPTGVFAKEQTTSYFEMDLTYMFTAPNPVMIGKETAKNIDMGITLKYQNGDNLETGDMHLDVLTLALTGRF